MTRRLLVSYLAVTVVVLVLLEVPFAIFFARRELDRLTASVERDASVLATFYEDDLEAGLVPDAQTADQYAARTGARVVVVDDAGISVVDTEQAAPRDFSTRPEIATALAGRRATGTRASQTLDTDLLYVAVPVASSGRVHGALRITLDTAEVDANVHRLWWGLAAIAAVVLAAMGLVGWLVARSVAQPLERLNDTARRFGEGDLTTEVPAEGPRELRELSATMATMARQLASMIDEQRAFVADASHQLRTPLTALRLRLENLQAGLDDPDAAQVDAAIDEIGRLATLVHDLLRLARADQHATPSPHDLARLAADRIDTWTAVAESAGVQLGAQLDADSLPVVAVPGAVEQIIDNLLDNALAWSPSGSTITVSVTAGSGATGATVHRLAVADEGPGLTDDQKAAATRRFWRADASTTGSGLGLSIVEALATASGGTVELSDTPGGGLTVTVAFPAAPEHSAQPGATSVVVNRSRPTVSRPS
ncbi:MAG: ATP-binding protein [Acidimicrobiales bacterium]